MLYARIFKAYTYNIENVKLVEYVSIWLLFDIFLSHVKS